VENEEVLPETLFHENPSKDPLEAGCENHVDFLPGPATLPKMPKKSLYISCFG
jgi:hypothetical protein